MSGKTHRLSMGDITCIVLHEGPVNTPTDPPTVEVVQGRYPNATVDEINAAMATDVLPSSLNALFIQIGDTRILVDVGMGDAFGPNVGHIPAALASEGISEDDIDLIFITHFHGDHFNGLLTGDDTPRYPNARYATLQTEWDHWMSDATLNGMDADRAAGYRKISDLLGDAFTLMSDGDALAPGVTLVDMPGHTPGHCGLLVESNNERLFHVVDLLHSLSQFMYTHWQFVYDTDGDLGVESRRRVLSRAADDNLLTLFYHLPFPGLGYVARADDGTFTFSAKE